MKMANSRATNPAHTIVAGRRNFQLNMTRVSEDKGRVGKLVY
jgi:hypothetical protein